MVVIRNDKVAQRRRKTPDVVQGTIGFFTKRDECSVVWSALRDWTIECVAQYGEYNVMLAQGPYATIAEQADRIAFNVPIFRAMQLSSPDRAVLVRNSYHLKRPIELDWHWFNFWIEGAENRWPMTHEQLVDAVLTIGTGHSLPSYVVLWIGDWLPGVARHEALRKLRLIDAVFASIQRVKTFCVYSCRLDTLHTPLNRFNSPNLLQSILVGKVR